MEEAVSTSILVCLCLIQRQNPVFLFNPSSWFSVSGEPFPSPCVRRMCPATPSIHDPLSCLSSALGLYLSAVDKSAKPPKMSRLGRKKIGFSTLSAFKAVWEIDLPLLFCTLLPSCVTPACVCVCFDTCSCCEHPVSSWSQVSWPKISLSSSVIVVTWLRNNAH